MYPNGVRHDYKDAATDAPARSERRWSWFAFGLILPILTVTLLLVSEPNQSKVPASADLVVAASSQAPALAPALDRAVPLPIPRPEPALGDSDALRREVLQTPSAPVVDVTNLSLEVRRGDTLELMFKRNGLSLSDLAEMASLPDASAHLRLLKPGERIDISHHDGHIQSLTQELDERNSLQILRGKDGFEVSTLARELDVHTVAAHGVITTSLFDAGTQAGISDATTMRMAGMFQWDIDFIQDVRVGDEFTIIYEQLWRDGVKLRDGDIVAAEFINRGEVYRAARFTDSDGNTDYYTPDGRSVRKAFVRAPVAFTRISSNFNPNRRHPVLNTIRAHQGVDYAAPIGTPVKAAGDGKIIFRGTKGGYGNAIVIQHGGNITTLYGHLSRFADQHVGSRVEQNEIIGYVGQSGLATGPHLHYEYRIDGVHRNPRTVDLPLADPISAEDRAEFQAKSRLLWRQLDLYQRARMAAAGN